MRDCTDLFFFGNSYLFHSVDTFTTWALIEEILLGQRQDVHRLGIAMDAISHDGKRLGVDLHRRRGVVELHVVFSDGATLLDRLNLLCQFVGFDVAIVDACFAHEKYARARVQRLRLLVLLRS